MKNIYKSMVLLIAFVAMAHLPSNAQVVMKEFLSENHTGKVDNSVNNNGKPLYYKFEYLHTDSARIYYKLYLYKDASMKTPWMTMNVLMRDLTWTYYVDITFKKDGTDKVAAMIFKKDLRWSRVKFSPHPGCARIDPPVWERMNLVDDYDKLINNFLMQIDKNINLDCYAASNK